MTLLFQDKELLELMEDCHLLTGMKIVLFDENYTELAAYPASELVKIAQTYVLGLIYYYGIGVRYVESVFYDGGT